MSNDKDEIIEIVAQLQRLQIQESELLVRLERLSVTESQADNPPTQISREFRIGDLVHIKNPKPFQIKKGNIIKIGANRITVQSKNGSKIVRAPSNLIHIN
jgi:hypothetical protein